MKKWLEKFAVDSDRKEIVSKGFSFLIVRVVGLIAGYLFAIMVTRLYGADVYGLVSLSFAIFILAGILGRLGLDVNLVKYFAIDHNLNDIGLYYRVLLKSIVISCVLGALIYLFREPICLKLFGKPELEPYMLWTVLTLPFWAMANLSAGMLRARKKSNWFGFLSNTGRFLFSTMALLVFWLFFDDPLSAVKAHFYAILFLGVLGFVVVVPLLEKVSLKSITNSWFFLRSAIPMMLSSTILVLLGWMDTFVLGIYVDNSEIGIYNVALKIATATSFSLQGINAILAPKLAGSFEKGEMTQFNRQVTFSTKLNFFLTVGIVALIILFHTTILQIFGEEFQAGSSILIILCFGQLINSMSGSVGVILQMTGHQKIHQNLVLLALFLNLILNFLLTPRIGGLGAAIATTISILSWNILGAWYLKAKLNIVSYYNFR